MSAKAKATTVLIKKILEGVTFTEYRSWKSIDSRSIDISVCAEILKLNEYHEMIDAEDLQVIIFEHCQSSLDEHGELNPNIPKLTLAIDSDTRQFPKRYKTIMPLPQGKLKPAVINKHVKILNVDDEFMQKYVNRKSSGKALSPLLKAINYNLMDVKEGNSVLLIEDSGCVNRFYSEKFSKYDPMFTYKIYISLQTVLGGFRIVKHIDRLEQDVLKGFNFCIFDVNNNFQKSTVEAQEDGRYVDSIEVKDSELVESVNKLFGDLLTDHKVPGIKNSQTSIKNSLYWLFEAQKTKYRHLKIVNTVTAFDSFFDQNVSTSHKIAIIAENISQTIQSKTLTIENLNKLYTQRNGIVHGSKVIARAADYKSEKEYDSSSLFNRFNLEFFIKKRIEEFDKSVNKDKYK